MLVVVPDIYDTDSGVDGGGMDVAVVAGREYLKSSFGIFVSGLLLTAELVGTGCGWAEDSVVVLDVTSVLRILAASTITSCAIKVEQNSRTIGNY